jgi:hypothetical protein
MSGKHRALAVLALSLTLAAATAAVAVAATPPTGIEDQNDRLLRNLQAAQAERTQAAVAQVRAMERNLAPAPAVDVVAAQPIVRPDVATPGASVDVLATLLVGLLGGLVGGAAAMVGWAATTRRRRPRAAAGT